MVDHICRTNICTSLCDYYDAMMLTRFSAMAALFAWVAPAMAQDTGHAERSDGWLGAVIAIVLVLCVAVVALKSSKRGHQD